MLVKLREYADLKGISMNTIYSQIRRGQIIPEKRRGRLIYLDTDKEYLHSERATYIHKQFADILKKYPEYFGSNRVSDSRIYNTWRAMRHRCNNPDNKSYKFYGGKGIKVCDEWENSFSAFFLWAMSHGYAEDLTIDRIDSDKDYCPSNCRWLTMSENSHYKKEERLKKSSL